MSKAEKKNLAGIGEVKYNCVLRGSLGNVQATLTLKSGELEELNTLVTQRMDNQIKITIESVTTQN